MRQQAHLTVVTLRLTPTIRPRRRTLASRTLLATGLAVGLTVLLQATGAAAQMPSAREMSGIPRPVDDLPVGSIFVRVVRGDLTAYVPSIDVQLMVGGIPRVVKTDAEGLAKFTGLAPGTAVRASTTLDGEFLQSEEFPMPAQGGVRMLLSGPTPGAAGGAAAGAAPAKPIPGTVVFGGESRIIVQFADDDLEGYYLLDVMNAGRAPVTTDPLVLEMPAKAQGTALLEGSSPQASVQGRRVTISGPFAPGRTLVELGYTIPPSGDSLRIAQRFPAPLAQVSLVVQKVGDLTMMSSAVSEQQTTMNQGRAFIMGNGPGLRAGETITIDLAGLPHVPRWPRALALGIAVLVLAIGGWAAARPGVSGAESARGRLEARRKQLLDDVQALDERLRAGRIDAARHAAGREALLAELEQVYGTLDTGAAARDGGMRHAG